MHISGIGGSFDRPALRWGVLDRTEFREEEGSVADSMALLSEMDAG